MSGLKRTYDAAMGSQSAQQISAGLVTTKDPVYYDTNMVYISSEDTNVDHGVSANFSQTRILPIVGRTSRAEVAIESADIQTKCLPIFQPQVKLGTDVNELIYEVGVSAQWRGSMLSLPPDTTPLDTLIIESGEDVFVPYATTTVADTQTKSGSLVQTFSNNTKAVGTLMDAYGLTRSVSLVPNNLYKYTFPQNTEFVTLNWSPPDTNGYNVTWDNSNESEWVTFTDQPNARIKCFVYSDPRPLLIALNINQTIAYAAMAFIIHNDSTSNMTLTYVVSGQSNGVFNPNTLTQVSNVGNSTGDPTPPLPQWTYSSFSNAILGNPASNTVLSTLFQYWNGSFQAYDPVTTLYGHSEIASTCLTPVCVGSAVQKINGCGLFESNIEYPQSMVVPIQSTDGFKAGDRVRFFGMTDLNAVNVYVPTVFGTVIDVISYNQLQNPSVDLSPALIVDYFPEWTITTVTYTPSPNILTLSLYQNFTFDSNAMYVGQRVTIANAVPGTGAGVQVVNGIYTVASVTRPALNSATPGVFSCTLSCGTFTQTANPTVWTGGTLSVSSVFTGGYVINQNSKDGGRIQLLTNEHAYQPRLMQLQSCQAGTNELVLATNMNTNVDLFNTGWFKGCGVESSTNIENFPLENVVVELSITPPPSSLYGGVSTVPNFPILAASVNGYYRIVKRTFLSQGSGGNVNFTLVPINSSVTTFASQFISTGKYDPISFTMKLAPNFYTFDTRADYVIDDRLNNSVNELAFLRSLGYKPTTDLMINTPTYPPTALIPDTTWDRAFTVDWSLSSYQNLKWTPQNTISRIPNPPVQSQDFGINSNSTTYYNVYEINKFINSCVNTGIKNLYTDYTDSQSPDILEIKSLNTQLELCFNSYKFALITLTQDNTSFVWSPTKTYSYGDIAVDTLLDGGTVYMATKQVTGVPLPAQGNVSYEWMILGLVPSFDDTILFNALDFSTSITPSLGGSITYFSVVNSLLGPTSTIPDQLVFSTGSVVTSLLRTVPMFKTLGPKFLYDERTLLLSWTLDNYGFATNQTPYSDQTSSDVATLSYQRLSWGDKNSDEFMTFESNSSFKFLFDNFPAECISYQDTLSSLRNQNVFNLTKASQYPLIAYWIWDSTSTLPITSQYFTIFQSAESFSSCMSPVESIVIVSDNIPIAEQPTSPLYSLIDSSTTQSRSSDATALSNKIIGEIYLPYVPFQSARTVVKYEPFEMKFFTLLDTKTFKQLDYSLYYRHRITQELVPLIITNYGSVNIKFVFRPTST